MNQYKTYFLREVLAEMRSLDKEGKAIPFSIAFRTYNRFSKKGGILKRYPVAKLVMQEEYKKEDSILSLRRAPRKQVARKNPNHFDNKTRNIKLPTGQIKKININYIVEFNGKKVVY